MIDGQLDIHIDRRLSLEQASEAHRLLEQRATIGKIVLMPSFAF